MADLDHDGHQDLISGCYEGFVYVCRGTAEGFAPPELLRDRAGGRIHSGRYWDPETRAHTGEGDRLLSAFPYDVDGDGDLDIVLGSDSGVVRVRHNEGTAQEPLFATDDEPLGVTFPGRHALPVVADWDGDGRPDLVTGSYEGPVHWARNLGSGEKEHRQTLSTFAAPQLLVGRDTDRGIGSRTQVAVHDVDGDGTLDLVVGDFHARGGGGRMHGYVWLVRGVRHPAPGVDDVPTDGETGRRKDGPHRLPVPASCRRP